MPDTGIVALDGLLPTQPESTEDLALKRRIDELHLEMPYAGAEMLSQLLNLEITRSNHVWAADIIYIPMKRGFAYLFAVLDWASRRVLSWLVFNTLTLGGTGDNQSLRHA